MTGIQWTAWPGRTGETWNPTTGCTRVSAGCDNCYAFTLHDGRFAANLRAADDWLQGRGARELDVKATPPTERIRFARLAEVLLPCAPQYDRPFSEVQVLDDERLEAPLHWREPRAVFVGSMADLFHDDVDDVALDRIFAVMALTPQHEYMLLTKRPERMRDYLDGRRGSREMVRRAVMRLTFDVDVELPPHWDHLANGRVWPLPNVGVMTTTEDQEQADRRVPQLLETPAAWHGLSVEPMLGPIALPYEWLRGERRVGWVIAGGESGARKRVRPFHLEAVRQLRDECAGAGVPFFLKQLGSLPLESGERPPGVKHGHGGRPDEWPTDLGVRQWPAQAHESEPRLQAGAA